MPVASGALAHALADQDASRARRWSDLRTRVLSAAVLAPMALLCLWVGGWPWIVLVVVTTLGLAYEWRNLARRRPGPWFLAAGLLCILPGISALIWLRADRLVGRSDMLFVVAVVWASDIGAYMIGRLLGGPKLAPAISPGKTWSGAGGGLACAMLIGVLSGGGAHAMLVAAGLSLAAQCGDLLESGIKRHAGVKDSGTLIPGHGGLLDRLDGVLAAAPAAALLAMALGRGVEIWQ
jgi:phosphatidate cytidylyltransferase